MKTVSRPLRSALAASAALAFPLAGAPRAEPVAAPPRVESRYESDPAAPARTAQDAIDKWPPPARALALATIAVYGQPARFSDDSLVWYANGEWKRTVVTRNAWPRRAGPGGPDYLGQTIAFAVPPGKEAALARFDDRLSVDAARSELTAWSSAEATNYLALNLAAEIAAGLRRVEDARDFQRRTEELRAAGKSSPYLERFVFAREDGRVYPPRAFSHGRAP